MSATEYTETLLFAAMNDGSDKPTTYNLTGSTESTPVAREGGRLAFKLRLTSLRSFLKAISLPLRRVASSWTTGSAFAKITAA